MFEDHRPRNNVTGTSFTDTIPHGRGHLQLLVTATSAGGTSSNSVRPSPCVARAPARRARLVDGHFSAGNQHHSQLVVRAGAVGDTSSVAQRTCERPLHFPSKRRRNDLLRLGLEINSAYCYQVAAVNAAVIPPIHVSVPPPPPGPSLTAVPGNGQVLLRGMFRPARRTICCKAPPPMAGLTTPSPAPLPSPI